MVALNLHAPAPEAATRRFVLPEVSLPGAPMGLADSVAQLNPAPDQASLVEQEPLVALPGFVDAPADSPGADSNLATPEPSATRTPISRRRQPAASGPGPNSTPTPEPTPAEPTQVAYAYTVRDGDTLSDIARQFGVSVESILWNNIHVGNADELYIGQQLQIPALDGLLYNVVLGDTLTDIARTHSARAQDIIAFKPNQIGSPDQLRDNVTILIPGGQPPAPSDLPDVVEIPSPSETTTPSDHPADQPTEQPTEQPTAPSDSSVIPVGPAYTTDRLRLRRGSGTQHEIVTVMPLYSPVEVLDAPSSGFYPVKYLTYVGWASGDYLAQGEAPAPPPAPTSTYGFQWPLLGPINSYFGPGHPLGIDIGTNRQIGLPIVASLDGTVVFAGGNPCCSYGLYVILRHGNGFETRYAHFSRVDVAIGQQVTRGQQIGLSGSTGYSTGPHLHFEIRQNGVPVNPLDYLP